MSELRERFAKTNALENMNRNAKITDVSIDLSFSFDWNGKQRKDILIGTVRDKYKSVSGEEQINRKLAEKLCTEVRKNTLDDSEWLEEKQKSRENILTKTDLKNVNGDVYLTPTVYIRYTYFDGEERTVKMNYKVTADSHSLLFLRPSVSEMYAEKTTDDIYCQFSDQSFVMDRTTTFSKNMSQTELLVKNYLEAKEPWMVADFGEITETDDDGTKLLIHSKDATVDIVFDNPDDTSSRIFELASCFDYENPYNLQNERLQLAPVTVVNDIPYRHNFWAIRKDQGNNTCKTEKGLFTRLENMFSSVVS